MSSLEIRPILCRRDNYAYLIVDGRDAWVVDPTEFEPVKAALEDGELELHGILATHHHLDHVGGIEELCQWREAMGKAAPWVAAHESDRGRIPRQSAFIPAIRRSFNDSGLRIGQYPVFASHIPGHTLGAIAWKIDDHIFTGDTLFSGGCGRLFEGTPADMYESLQTICSGPGATKLWFGHEYTKANLNFARAIEPDNLEILQLLDNLQVPSCPSTIARERAINVFVRAADALHLAKIRTAKDNA